MPGPPDGRRGRFSPSPDWEGKHVGAYRDVNGAPFTDEDVEQWASEAESEKGYTGTHLGPSEPGRPTSTQPR